MTTTNLKTPANEYFAELQKHGYHRSGCLLSLLEMIEFSMRSWSEVITAWDDLQNAGSTTALVGLTADRSLITEPLRRIIAACEHLGLKGPCFIASEIITKIEGQQILVDMRDELLEAVAVIEGAPLVKIRQDKPTSTDSVLKAAAEIIEVRDRARNLNPEITRENLPVYIGMLRNSIFKEMDASVFVSIDWKEAESYKNDRPFGDSVWEAFPSANPDIEESVKCLVLERYTAVVFHLMRVTEVGLRALGDTVGAPYKTDWGQWFCQDLCVNAASERRSAPPFLAFESLNLIG